MISTPVTAAPAIGYRARLRSMPAPHVAHYLSLVAAFAWLLFCARGQWFFYDEWDFLKLSSTDFLTPHLGHWSTMPMLLTAALRESVGLGSYWPYLVPTLLVHLGIAHALWRVMLRIRVSPWIAAGAALVVDVPAYALRMIVGGLDGLTPVPFLGLAIFAASVLFTAVFARRLWGTAPSALALAAAAAAFALVTALSRIDFSADTSTSSRYIYLTTVLLMPVLGLLASWIAARNRGLEIALVVALGLTAVYGGAVLRAIGSAQALTEQNTRDLLAATAGLIDDPPVHLDLSAYPDPDFAPSVNGADVKALVDSGALPPMPYSQSAYDIALERLASKRDAPTSPDPE